MKRAFTMKNLFGLICGMSYAIVFMSLGCTDDSNAVDDENETSLPSDTASNSDQDMDSATHSDSDTTEDSGTDVDSDSNPPIPPENLAKRTLAPVDNCESAWEIAKNQFINDMLAQVEANRKTVLTNKETDIANCEVNQYVDDGFNASSDADTDSDTDTDTDTDADGDADGEKEGADEYSTTNTQVKGVDEADFYKNDGNYIYILADGSFQIINAWPAQSAAKVSTTPIDGEPKKLYVYENKAVIYSSLNPVSTNDSNFYHQNYSSSTECTYGYDCDFVGDGKMMKMSILDISDLNSPQLIRETVINGSYLNSRRIGNAVYTIGVFPEMISAIPGVTYVPAMLNSALYSCAEDISQSAQVINALFDALVEYNLAIIDAFDFSAVIPSMQDTKYVNGEAQTPQTLLQDCNDFYVSQAGDGKNLIVVAGLNLETNGDFNISALISKPGAVYADSDSLYVGIRHYRNRMPVWFYEDESEISEATTIHKFNLTPDVAGVEYQGSGVVKGRILNQFSMDEHDSHLRIATTTGHLPSPNVHSTMSILATETDERNLTLTGQIDNIAPSEDIRSARFKNDLGFIVTFKKTDPLFVFDLSNPAAPEIKGELKIPGFSTYMHIMDDTHVLSIGFDADEQGSFAYFQGIQLQILDITDVSAPTLLHKEVIGTRGSTSDATSNHLAFNYFKNLDRLAIPMVVCEESSSSGSYGQLMTFSGLMVFDVTVENGFNYLGGIPHEAVETDAENWGACNNWWTNSNSKVKRSIFMDDYVYSIAMDSINISHVDSLESPVSAIPLISQLSTTN